MNAPVTSPVATSKGRVVCYMAGGTGINIAKVLTEQFKKLDMNLAADMEVVLIDTSESNLGPNGAANTYLLKGLDGSGKIRKENHTQISRSALSILEKHQPGDLNIVVSSLGGGSGSVIAPVLTGALLEQGKMVVACGVVTQSSVIEIDNSIKTIQSYDSISRKQNKPIVLSIQKNTDGETFKKINEAVVSTILMLAVLYSRKNVGLDSADLRNWINYQRVSKAPVKAVTLDISSGSFSFKDDVQPITTATLVREGVSSDLDWMPDYQCVGYVPPDIDKTNSFEKPMHFTVCDGEIANIFGQLDELKKELDRKVNARTYSDATIKGDEDVQDDGLVL